MMAYKVVSVICVLVWSQANGEPAAGLIRTGVDTTHYQLGGVTKPYGMDFVLERPCSTAVEHDEGDCYPHFATLWYGGCYDTRVEGYGCRFKRYGKINLDDITTVPPDSELVEDAGQGIGVFMCAPPDSLADYIGNVYVMKSGIDPRRDIRIHAKIKVLDFWVIDDAHHEIAMVFLWAYNYAGYPDLTTDNVDTFTLDYHVDTIPQATVGDWYSTAGGRQLRRAAGYRVVVGEEGRISLPPGMLDGAETYAVFDARGRAVGKIGANATGPPALTGVRNRVVVVREVRR
jgi:hypothetical protein